MPLLIRTDSADPDDAALLKAADILRSGGIIAYPTETFYGLGADAGNEKAVESIYTIKGRGFDKPLPLIIGDRGSLAGLVEAVPETARRLMDAFWPGGLTIIFLASPRIIPKLTGGTGKIGIRVSSNPVASRLSAMLDRPITATSANLSGEKENATASEVREALGDRVDAIVDAGRTLGGLASTVIDVTTDPPSLLRAGAIPPALIRRTLGKNG